MERTRVVENIGVERSNLNLNRIYRLKKLKYSLLALVWLIFRIMQQGIIINCNFLPPLPHSSYRQAFTCSFYCSTHCIKRGGCSSLKGLQSKATPSVWSDAVCAALGGGAHGTAPGRGSDSGNREARARLPHSTVEVLTHKHRVYFHSWRHKTVSSMKKYNNLFARVISFLLERGRETPIWFWVLKLAVSCEH